MGLGRIKLDDTESQDDSIRLSGPNEDAREGSEQARIRSVALNSVDSSQLIPLQDIDEPGELPLYRRSV